MKILKEKNKITITNLEDFNINQIFDCGQIFRYWIDSSTALCVSTNKLCKIITSLNKVEILSQDIDYFENFFDLNTDYSKIKQTLKKDDFLRPCCEFGYGIRILKQNLFEMIVSFIISANNNIKRIKNSLNYLSEKYGEKKVGIDNIVYYSFPTLNAFKKITVEEYKTAGLGYRAEQLYSTIQKLNEEDLVNFNNLSTEEKHKFLLNLKGVGEKVANCIMLFTASDFSSFPVDTWIQKVYNHITNTNEQNRHLIMKILKDKYGDLAGYAQQYFFYYYRENKLI